jgi:hypothetical protein
LNAPDHRSRGEEAPELTPLPVVTNRRKRSIPNERNERLNHAPHLKLPLIQRPYFLLHIRRERQHVISYPVSVILQSKWNFSFDFVGDLFHGVLISVFVILVALVPLLKLKVVLVCASRRHLPLELVKLVFGLGLLEWSQ